MKAIVLVLAVTAMAAADFTDDFESYSPGEFIESSPDWDREPSGGQVQVVAQTGNQAIESVFTDSTFIGYICTGAGFWTDGEVSMDVSPQGVGSFSNVYARLNVLDEESYAAGVTVFLGSFTYSYIAFVDSEGNYELLYSDLGPVIGPGEWANVKLHVEGENPVALTLFIDGVQQAKVYDYTHLLEEGICGFALFYDDENPEPVLLADNFQVIVTPQSFDQTTLGALKALFR